jgi:hypothetical protein
MDAANCTFVVHSDHKAALVDISQQYGWNCSDADQPLEVRHDNSQSSLSEWLLDFLVRSGGSRDAVEPRVYRHLDQASFSDTRDCVVIAIDCSRSGSMAWFGPSGPFGWVLRSVVRERLGVFVFETSAVSAVSAREAVVQQATEAGLRCVKVQFGPPRPRRGPRGPRVRMGLVLAAVAATSGAWQVVTRPAWSVQRHGGREGCS